MIGVVILVNIRFFLFFFLLFHPLFFLIDSPFSLATVLSSRSRGFLFVVVLVSSRFELRVTSSTNFGDLGIDLAVSVIAPDLRVLQL